MEIPVVVTSLSRIAESAKSTFHDTTIPMSTSIIEGGDTDYGHVRNTQTWHPVITDQDFGSSTG